VNVLFYDINVLGYMMSNGSERRRVKDLEVTGRGFIEATNQRLSEGAEQTPKPRQLISETARSDHVCGVPATL
jgi:hypothetical protein